MSASTQTCRAKVLLADEGGLHLRPAAKLVTVASQFDSEIFLEHEGRRANGKSLLSVVMLCAEVGARLTVLAKGQDAPQAVKAIRHLFKRLFGNTSDVSVGAPVLAAASLAGSEAAVPATVLAATSRGRRSAALGGEFPESTGFAAGGDAASAGEEASASRSRPARTVKKIHTFVFTPESPAKDVSVAGEFSQWDLLPMAYRNGVFQASVRLAPGVYPYKFVVDGQWIEDPTCAECVPNGLGSTNSVVRIE